MENTMVKTKKTLTEAGPQPICNNRRNKQAQASIEVTFALVCIMILLFAMMRFFVWVNNTMIVRQRDYEKTRVDAGSAGVGEGVFVDESDYEKLDFFGKSK